MEPIWDALQNLWNSILELTAQFVIPDWGAIIALIPIVLALVVLVFVVWVIRRWATAGPKQRGPGPRAPTPPAGVHMPGPSFAPFFAAIGAALTFLGVIFGGWLLVLGLLALLLTLLYWLREGVRDYEHIEPALTSLPAVVHPGPPPGVHMPGPSFRPILASAGVFVIFLGLVVGGWVILAGIVVTILSLLGWLLDAQREYRYTVEADATGHLRNGPDPRFPVTSVAISALIVAVAVAINTGIIPPRQAEAGGGSGSPAPSGNTGSPAPGSAPPSQAAGPSVPPGDVVITAEGFKFQPNGISFGADKPFTIAFVNEDSGVPHDIVISDSSGAKVFEGDPVTGAAAAPYKVPALKAGTYPFVCSFHANMTGTLTIG